MLPSHVLVVGPPQSGKLRLASLFCDLAAAKDELAQESHSGLILSSDLSTRYYTTSLKFLIDEYYEDREDSLETWRREFVSGDARELRDILEGLIFTVHTSSRLAESTVESLSSIRDLLDEEQDDGGGMWSGFVILVGIGEKNPELEDMAVSSGIEYIHWEEDGQNEFKDKLGKARIKELFETHEWKQMEWKELQKDDGYEERKRAGLGGMAKSLLEHADEDDNEDDNENEKAFDLDLVMRKLNLAKEDVKGMSQKEKELHARKVIDEVMNYL